MFANLQFRDYHVTNIEYKYSPYFGEDEDPLNPQFAYSVESDPDDLSQASVTLSFSIGDPQLVNNSIYVSVSIMGLFELSNVESEDRDTIMLFYRQNALAILFPYLRGIVSDITSKGSEAPLILPTLNIMALIEELDRSQDSKKEQT